ncbi:unnamed protein product [Tilletia laevis]|nr:unnamed protein product [Tilletia laevis]
MPLPPPRKPAAVPANNDRVAAVPGRQRGGGFTLPPPPADSDAYSTDSDSSDDEQEEDDDSQVPQAREQQQQQGPNKQDPSKSTGKVPADGPAKRGEDGDRIGTQPSAVEPSQKRKNSNSKTAMEAALLAQQAAAAAAATKRFQQQQQHLIQEQRRKAVQNQPSAKGTGPAAASKKGAKSAAASRSAAGKRASEEDEDDYDLGFGPGPSMSASQTLDMDIDGLELWTHSYCVVCDRLISEPSAPLDSPGANGSKGSEDSTTSPLAGPSQHSNGHGRKTADVTGDASARRGSKAASSAGSGTAAPVRRNNSSSRLSGHAVRAGSGGSTSSGPPRRVGSTGSRLNALSNLKPTTKLHQDKEPRGKNAAAPSTSSESAGAKSGISRADSSASIASRAGSSSVGGSSPPKSVSSSSSVRSRGKPRSGGIKAFTAGSGTHSHSHSNSSVATAPSLSGSSIVNGPGRDEDKEKTKEKLAAVAPLRHTKSGLYCSERCRLIDEQRSAGLGQLRPYLSHPISPRNPIAPAAIAVTTVGSDQPTAVIPVSSSSLGMSIAAASRSNSLPVLAATAVMAANANGSTPMPALLELAQSSAEGSATLNHGLSMSMGYAPAAVVYAPSGGSYRGQPVLTSQTALPIDPSSAYGTSGSILAAGLFPLLTGSRNDWTPGSECPDCSDCIACAECEEAEARTTSATSGTAPSGSVASDTATSESSHAALSGLGGNGANGLDSLGGTSGSGGAAGKGKQRSASGRLLTPHNLIPLSEGETDYFGAYPEQIRRVLLDEQQRRAAAARQHHYHHHHHRSTSPEVVAGQLIGRPRSQSDQSTGSDNGASTAMGSVDAGYGPVPLATRHPLLGRRGTGTGTAISGSGVGSRPRSSSSQMHGTAATNSASTSFSAAPTVQPPSVFASLLSDSLNSSAITAVPGDRRARSTSRTRSTSVPDGEVDSLINVGSELGRSSDVQSSLRGAGVLGTSLGTALHRRSVAHARDASDSVRTSTNSSRRSTIVSGSYASPLRLLQPGEVHTGSPSVAAFDFEAMRDGSLAEQGRAGQEEVDGAHEDFARLRRNYRGVEWPGESSNNNNNSQAVSIPASSWRGHRRAGSAMSARTAFDNSLDAGLLARSVGGRPASVDGTSGLSFGALNSLKRAQALAVARELDRERTSPRGSVDVGSLSLSGAEGGASVSVATPLDAVREDLQEHHRTEDDELGLVRGQDQRRPSEVQGLARGHDVGSESVNRRYSTGATPRSGGSGFLQSIWSSFRGGSSSTHKDGMPRTSTAPAAPPSAMDASRKTLPSLLSHHSPAPVEVVKEEDEEEVLNRGDDTLDPEDRALNSSTNLDRGETIKPSKTGRGVAGQGAGAPTRRFDSLRSEASGRDAASVRSGSTGAGSDWSSNNNNPTGTGSGGRAYHSLAAYRSGADRSAVVLEQEQGTTKLTKPATRRGSVPFFTQEVGHGQIPGDAADSLEDADGRPRSFSSSSHQTPASHPHRHSISNGAAAGVDSVERRKLAKQEQQRAHRHQRSRDVSMLPPLLAPNARSNSASSSNLRMMHGSALVHPGNARASSHGRIAPAAPPLGSFGGLTAAPGVSIPPTIRSPRSFQGVALVDPLVNGFSPTRSSTIQTVYGSSPRGRLGWGSSMTPLSAAGSATSSAAITPVASAVNLAMMGQPQSYSASYRPTSTPAFAGLTQGAHGHSHSHSHALPPTPSAAPPATGHLGMLGSLPPSHTAHFNRHATMPSFRSSTPSVPEHGGEMSSEALSRAGAASPTIKVFARGGSGFVQPAGGPLRPRSGAGWRGEGPAQQALPVGAIENITFLTQEQYQEHLQQQSQQQQMYPHQQQQQQKQQRYDRSRRTWSHEALSSMAGSGKTYPIMALPGNGEVHDVYDSEWTSIIGSTRQRRDASDGSTDTTPSAANPGTTTGTQQRKALFHFGEPSRDSQGF